MFYGLILVCSLEGSACTIYRNETEAFKTKAECVRVVDLVYDLSLPDMKAVYPRGFQALKVCGLRSDVIKDFPELKTNLPKVHEA